MRNLFQKNSPKPNLPRNVFDLSQHRIFSAKAGMLLPCYVDEVNPNESYRINVNSFLRTQPLNSAAYARFNQRVDFFFVPLRLLCRNFSNALFGTEHQTSNMQVSYRTDFAKLGINPLNIGCFLPCKGTNFSANHNLRPIAASNSLLFLTLQRYKFFS